ncbi:uncharacterized protein LOC106163016 [Lingula anatina]|uniref:Phospholipase A2 n=1 Tax=Lingula anatina TaxID=7574 RepID=A0A1S3IEQ1_LINAN|nr:uncharacterized protein LOC106163016 [Lingula anatina]|eukprot:XP_013395939.1 uncharacterized protein LOC106163016 [Lingula anatina]
MDTKSACISVLMILAALGTSSAVLDQEVIDKICDTGIQLNTHPESCNKYVQCHHGIGFERDCPAEGMRFNVVLGVCDWGEATECLPDGWRTLRRLGCTFDPQNIYNKEFHTNPSLPVPANSTDLTPYLEACVKEARLSGILNFAISFDGRCLTTESGNGGDLEGLDASCTIYDVFEGGLLVYAFEETPVRTDIQPSVVEFGLLVLCSTGANPLSYNGYGCYCGLGGSGTPVDETDKCCKIHDDCYTAIQTSGTCALSISVYVVPYSWDGCNPTVCKPASYYWFFGTCRNAVCECDAAAAQCFSDHRETFSQNYVNYDKDGKC